MLTIFLKCLFKKIAFHLFEQHDAMSGADAFFFMPAVSGFLAVGASSGTIAFLNTLFIVNKQK
ncbi:hypothetical protein SAMN05421736_11317 [Evansella caseinilytica]|uniref:Uncharacterized protein n=1 Tax=Evansella caseinilytica TaxID=1503961 RepID=A0A1H3T446_9BACI|nr:hypothetical protein SAMN05421736_11317 [Evansella caseinilytica]